MPTRRDTNFPSLTNPNEFEMMLKDICALEWNDPNTNKFGRKGQKQYGVDIYGQPVDLKGKYRGTQCKLRTKKEQLREQEIEAEVSEARTFPHELDTLIIATDAPHDTHTQILVDKISQRELDHGNFRVIIWFWDNITERLAAYPKLIVKYYPDFYANLTTLPIVERLIDTPLQIVSVTQLLSNPIQIENMLELRGIRILRPDTPRSSSINPLLNDVLPDGIVCTYSVEDDVESADSALLNFASMVLNQIQQVEGICPIFVIMPSPLTAAFLRIFTQLGGADHRIQLLNAESPLEEVADQIFQDVFHYGYTRRGSLATIDIAIRTREGRPVSILLDLDWQTMLSTSHFSTPAEWQETLIPALTVVRNQLLNQSDRSRIQISCQLPLPAAFALGFSFNLRVARIGVWARRTKMSDFKQQFWLSDGSPADVTFKSKWIEQSDGNDQTAIVELTSYVTIHKAVEAFVKDANLSHGVWLQVSMDGGFMPTAYLENIEEGYAVAYANQVGQIIRHLNAQGVTDIHLFARIPAPLAVLIGQRLHACGRIHLYWFKNPSYQFAFTLM